MLLQTFAADRKSRVLKEFMQVALAEFNLLFSHVKGAVPLCSFVIRHWRQ